MSLTGSRRRRARWLALALAGLAVAGAAACSSGATDAPTAGAGGAPGTHAAAASSGASAQTPQPGATHTTPRPAASATGSVTGLSAGATDQAPLVALSALPPQAAATVALIRQGGPFPYPRNDGVVFANRERRLPDEPNGYYHEYTVPTPGATDRGARRIITGADGQFFYTGDHYETFVRVDVSR
ncbi:MAG: hypothetical protein FWD74_09520 [Actinomycetia bacterium]|nr:hypothetical protein [Actinomycetes bacterium]